MASVPLDRTRNAAAAAKLCVLRDIIAIKKLGTELKYLIECKRPDPGNVVGIKPVRELFGVKQDEKASKAILVTTSCFSPDAIQFVERNK